MNTLGDRIQYVLHTEKISREELADKLGVTTMAVGNLINNKVKKPRIFDIANALNVEPDWLQSGSGVMIKDSKLNNSPITNSVATNINDYGNHLIKNEPDSTHSHRIDYLDVRAAAGLVEYSNSDYPEIISSIWLSDDGLMKLVGKRNSNGLRIINVPTDSMEPTIPKGSPVVIDTKVNSYIGDGIYAFSSNGNLFIKRIQKLMKGGYKIISDNKELYDPEEINDEYLDNAKFVGKFIRVWKIETIEL
ncbi:S24 family peptidase [Mannheimia sp. AT1]|uniref:S24 family peptidase n=1 Tax=Mannheimia cairinae TaxID=3025936 RepID=A0ABT5MR10_9PAST|nr:XRE family transcriptional regulator [Mannheimia cairinae]MDD0824629.1 S24 family peptidase [Mannheimia cairinae]MDD0826442.1 S24 family peptidase [Mannheimia cairinae]